MAESPGYRKDIDGLRAVAVLPVVFYHAGFATFSGGYVGVDVFFVISGFLITSIIFRDIQAQQFSYRQFYARRVRRLFPALFSVVLASCVAAHFLLLPEELRDFGQSVFSIVLFASNFLFWSEAGYFAAAAELKPLLHTWSLAIEEQYYLLFPVFLLAIQQLRNPPYLLCVWALLLLSFGVSLWSVSAAPDAAFYLLPSRMWELLLGSVLAMKMPVLRFQALAEVLAAAGLVLILYAVFAFDAGTPFPGAAAFVPCLGTVFILVAGAQYQCVVTRLLSVPALVFVGLISYSLYLWHWPLIVFTKHYLGTPLAPEIVVMVVVASLGLSVLSWRFIEQPFRGAGALMSTTGLFRGAVGVGAMLVVTGLVFDLSRGLPQRLPESIAGITATSTERPLVNERCGQGLAHNSFSDPDCRLLSNGPEPSIVIWGDSHASVLLPAIRQGLQRVGRNAVYTIANGCAPLLGVERTIQRRGDSAQYVSCLDHNHAVFERLTASASIDTVVVAARWGFHAQGLEVPGQEGAPRFLQSGSERAVSAADNRVLFTAALTDTLKRLSQAGKTAVVLGAVPEASGHVPDLLAKSFWHGRAVLPSQPLADFLERQAPVYEALEQTASSAATIVFVPLHQPFCDAGVCIFSYQDRPLFFDDNHLSEAGVNRVTPVLTEFFESAAK
ncbi:MAG: acyltransferase family protein [bacterium]